LNMVEIEIGVLRGQCLDRRIATPERLVSEIAAWERRHPGPGQMDVHNRKSPHQNGPRISRASQHQSAPDERVIILVQRY
jgi:hypothetical protein